MYLRWRSERRNDKDGPVDADKRQVGNGGDGFTIKVETLAGGLLMTLTHAIVDAVATLPPDNPVLPSVAVPTSESQTISTSFTDIPPPSNTLDAIISATGSILSSDRPLVTSSYSSSSLLPSADALISSYSSTFTTTIIPSEVSATSPATATATADLDSQEATGAGDAQRLPAVGITVGALAAAGVLIVAGIMLYKYKHRTDVKLKPGKIEKRQFQGI